MTPHVATSHHQFDPSRFSRNLRQRWIDLRQTKTEMIITLLYTFHQHLTLDLFISHSGWLHWATRNWRHSVCRSPVPPTVSFGTYGELPVIVFICETDSGHVSAPYSILLFLKSHNTWRFSDSYHAFLVTVSRLFSMSSCPGNRSLRPLQHSLQPSLLYWIKGALFVCFYHAMHFSAKRGIAIACRLSLRLSVCL